MQFFSCSNALTQLQYSGNWVISAMYTPNSNYLVEGGSKLSFWTWSSLNAARTKKKLSALQNSQPRSWPYEFWVPFIKPLNTQEFVGSFQSSNAYHLHSVFSDEFIMPTVAFLIYMTWFFFMTLFLPHQMELIVLFMVQIQPEFSVCITWTWYTQFPQ